MKKLLAAMSVVVLSLVVFIQPVGASSPDWSNKSAAKCSSGMGNLTLTAKFDPPTVGGQAYKLTGAKKDIMFMAANLGTFGSSMAIYAKTPKTKLICFSASYHYSLNHKVVHETRNVKLPPREFYTEPPEEYIFDTMTIRAQK